jgi:hypothetical protein
MASFKPKMCIGLFLCMTLCVPLLGLRRQNEETSKSCRDFVEGFYAWYLANALGPNQLPKSDLAWKSRPYLFSPDLVRQLREDFEAQEKAGSDLVSLDADPFVGGDGPAERYIVKGITIKDGKCWAEVHGVREGKESEKPDVTPELVFPDGRWRFVNFFFPGPSAVKGWNLLGALKADREFRNKYGPRGTKKP